jgi:hypothetical protein
LALAGTVGFDMPQGLNAQAVTTPVPAIFQPFYDGHLRSVEELKAVRDALPYESIKLERSGGMMVPGGLFKLVLNKDGSATLWTDGSRFGKAGEYVGSVWLTNFGKLSHLIAEAGLDRLAPRYAVHVSDETEDTVTVVARDRTMTVVDYGGAGPVQLWAIQRAIEAVGLGIRWTPK